METEKKDNKKIEKAKEDLEKLEPLEREKIVEIFQTRAHSGPLPSAEQLEQYKRIQSDFPNRIIVMAEKESEHRMGQEKKLLNSNVRNTTRGAWFAFIITLLVVGSSVFLIYIGKSVAGLISMLGELTLIAGVFVFGRKSENSAKLRKEAQLSKDLVKNAGDKIPR